MNLKSIKFNKIELSISLRPVTDIGVVNRK